MKKVIVLFPLLVLTGSAASLCVSGALTSYLQMPGGCTVGSVLFSDFAFGGIGSTGAAAQQVQVAVSNDNGNPSLSFTGPFVSGPGMYLDDAITFTIVAPTIAVDMVAAVNASAGSSGSAKVNASSSSSSSGGQATTQNAVLTPGSVSTVSDLPAGTPVTVTEAVQLSNGGSVQAVSNTISDTPDPVALDTSTGIAGGAGMGGSTPVPNDPVPEPNTVFLVGCGLILCALLLRYSRRRA